MSKKHLLIYSIITFTLLVSPLTTFAQTTGGSGSSTLQRYNPTISIGGGSGSTFGGIKLSGVGAAGLSCASQIPGVKQALDGIKNTVTSAITTGLNSVIPGLGSVLGGITGQQQDYPDKTSQKLLKSLDTKEKCLDKVAYSLSIQVLNQMTQKTLNWANKGFGGNPLYVRDIDSYIRSVSNQKISQFLENAPGSDSVFGNTIRSIITQEATGKIDGLLNKAMNTPEAKKYQGFQDDFTNGGWSALLNPSYNSMEAVFNASDKLSKSLDTQEQNVREEVTRNNGFLDMKQCAEWANNGQTKDPTSGEPICLHWQTITPGALIAQQVSEVTKAPIEKIVQADELNEVLGGLFDSFMNKLFSKGLASLKGGDSTTFSGGGPGSNVVLDNNGKPLSNITENFYDSSGSAVGTDFDITRPQLLRAISQVQADYISRAHDSQIALLRLVPRLGILDYCLPGPNPTWQDGLSDNFQAFTESPTKNTGKLFDFIAGGPLSLMSNKIDRVDTTGIPLIDKVSGGSKALTGRPYEVKGKFHLGLSLYSSGTDVKPADFIAYMQQSFNELSAEYTNKFTMTNLTNAFLGVATTPSDQLYTRGFVQQAYGETSSLLSYVNDVAQISPQYTEQIGITQNAYDELELIRKDVNEIVSTAKARYIAQQKAAGTPVNQQCIDAAYVIDNTPIVPAARQESDTPDPIIDQANSATTYFYNNI